MIGYIHSIETMGTVDGPGLRYVVFTSGCPLRCKYCHNPDTWQIKSGKPMTVDEILADYESYRPFLKKGGLTVTGGEPLIQLDFIIELFQAAKNKNIHTCLDTSGATFSMSDTAKKRFIKLIDVVDLVMLDIKHIDKQNYYELTKGNLDETLSFLQFLEDCGKVDVWIRHVVVKDITYYKNLLYHLGYTLGRYECIKAIDVLPYHNMGEAKYKELDMIYPLSGMDNMSKEEAESARQIIMAGRRQYRFEQASILY